MTSQKPIDALPEDIPVKAIDIVNDYLLPIEILETVEKYCIHKPTFCDLLDRECQIIVTFDNRKYFLSPLDVDDSPFLYDSPNLTKNSAAVSSLTLQTALEPDDNNSVSESLVPLNEYCKKRIVLRIHEKITHDEAVLLRDFLRSRPRQVKLIAIRTARAWFLEDFRE